jgi:hypothetical protein
MRDTQSLDESVRALYETIPGAAGGRLMDAESNLDAIRDVGISGE